MPWLAGGIRFHSSGQITGFRRVSNRSMCSMSKTCIAMMNLDVIRTLNLSVEVGESDISIKMAVIKHGSRKTPLHRRGFIWNIRVG